MTCQNHDEETHNDNLRQIQRKPQHQEAEGNHSSSSTTIVHQNFANSPRQNKRKPNDQLDQLRQTRKGIMRGEPTEDKEGRNPLHAEDRQDRKRKAEDKLEGAKRKDGVCVRGIRKDPKEPLHSVTTERSSSSSSKEDDKETTVKGGSKTEFRGSHEGMQCMAEDRNLSEGRQDTSLGKKATQCAKVNSRAPSCRGSYKNERCFHCNSRPAKGEEFSMCPKGLAWIGFKPGRKGCSSCLSYLRKTEAHYLNEKGLKPLPP